MSFIQDLFVDSLNGFALKQIPFFLFQILCASLAAWILSWVLAKKLKGEKNNTGVIIAAAIAVITGIVKYSLPLSVMGAAVALLLFRNKEQSRMQTIATACFVLIGVGCGAGSILQTILGIVIISLLILFMPFKENEGAH